MGVLERFFQISFLLTFVLLIVNSFLTTFGYAMTGEMIVGLEDVNTSSVIQGTSTNTVLQTSSEIGAPTTTNINWDYVWDKFVNLIGGYTKVLNHIFQNIDSAHSGDAAEQVGNVIIFLLVILQVAGAAYIPWALLSAWKGGGSP